jgi:DhnA family fructose-bisphosphate aldolase class Ia
MIWHGPAREWNAIDACCCPIVVSAGAASPSEEIDHSIQETSAKRGSGTSS